MDEELKEEPAPELELVESNKAADSSDGAASPVVDGMDSEENAKDPLGTVVGESQPEVALAPTPTIEEINRQEYQIKQRPETAKFPLNAKGVYNPNEPWRKLWDTAMIVLLLFVALVTPYELAFVDTSDEGAFCKKFCGMAIVNLMIDIAFVADMGFNFNTAYFNFKHGVWVVDREMIANDYFRNWFFIDLVSIIPFNQIPAEVMGIDPDNKDNLALIRLFKLLRLLKLLRIARASRILDRLQNKIAVSFAAQALGKSALVTVTLCHWSACLIRLISGMNREACRGECYFSASQACFLHDVPAQWPQKQYFYDDDNVTLSNSMCYYRLQLQNYTYGANGFRQYVPYANQSQELLNATFSVTGRSLLRYCADRCRSKNWYDRWGFPELNNPSQYIAAFYWGIYNLKGCDSFAVALSEYIIAIIVMVAGGGVWMVLVADTCNVLGNLDVTGNEFRRNMDNLNSYLSKNHFHDRLKFKLRNYFNHCRSLFANKFYKETMERMSPVLQGEVAGKEHGAWIKTIPFFAKAPRKERRELIIDLAMSFTPMVYVPADTLVAMGSINKTMTVIQKGLAVKTEPPNMPRFLPASSVFGEDIILKTVTEKTKQRKWSVAAATYCDVFEITARKLLIILTSGMYKETYSFIRKHATRMLLRITMPLALKEAMENPAVHSFHDVAMLLTGELEEVSADVAQQLDEDNPGIPPEQMLGISGKFDSLETNFRKLGKRSKEAANLIRSVRAELYAFMKTRGFMGSRKGGLFQVDTTFTNEKDAGDGEERLLIPLHIWQEYWVTKTGAYARTAMAEDADDRVDDIEVQVDKLATFLATTTKNPHLMRDVLAMEEAVNSIAQKQRAVVRKIKEEVSQFSLYKEQEKGEDIKQAVAGHFQASWDP